MLLTLLGLVVLVVVVVVVVDYWIARPERVIAMQAREAARRLAEVVAELEAVPHGTLAPWPTGRVLVVSSSTTQLDRWCGRASAALLRYRALEESLSGEVDVDRGRELAEVRS